MIAESLSPLAVPVDSLELLEGNPRVGDVDAVAASLRRFGQRKPVVATKADRVVIAGNHTLRAARQLGWDEIAVVFVEDDEDTARAFALADNRTAELGGYDDENLAAMILAVREADEELLADTGWDSESVEELLGSLGPAPLPEDADPDAVPPEPETPKSMPGDVWLLGSHRVMCGDSTSPTDVDRLMGGVLADMVWTDPPYGVSYQKDLSPADAKRLRRRSDGKDIANDELLGENLSAFLRDSLGNALQATRDGAAWYVAAPAGPQLLSFAEVLGEMGVWRQGLVWVKDRFVLGRSDYHGQHEFIFYGWKPGASHAWHADRKQATVLEFGRPGRSPEHPTMKPVDLIAYCIGNNSKAGQRVLDLFGGSGSTLVAAHTTGRVAYLMEKDPKYVDVICRRYQELTGDKPITESTGNPHDFTAE